MKTSGLYIHIPFCDHKCIYCDFYSIINYDNISPFLKALKKEIQYYSSQYLQNRKFVSVFFGGGTPSFMEPGYIKEILSSLKENFDVDDNAEITLETNPGTVNKSKLKYFKEAGINRLSIGIQSFNDDELKFLTRIHDKDTALQNVQNALEAGFENISIDLIFNLPGQTKDKWLSNLSLAVELPVKHISAYSLILERGTILNKMVIDGKVEMQSDDYDADLYETTIEFLTSNSFNQYEVSNFAKPGYECLHNKIYWQHKEYIGLGTSAHSFIDGKRWWNFSSLNRYINEIETNGNAVASFEELTPEERHEEFVMLALRSSGLNLKEYNNQFGMDWILKNNSYFELLMRDNLMKIENDKIYFTSKGFAVCDEILKNIL